MPWISLIIRTDAAHAESLSDALLEHGAISVDIHDALADSDKEQPLFGEPGNSVDEIWQNAEVSGLFDDSMLEHIPGILTELARSEGLSDFHHHIEHIAEQDWIRQIQSQFSPIAISQRLWIVPSWHVSPDPAAINLLLDPGLAFGTGSHPTTQLCLRWLEKNLKSGDTLIDYGCGSGILAIAALKLGAMHVTGIDIDLQAINVSNDNAIRNRCNPQQFSFCSTYVPDKPVNIVIANILANPLILLAPLLATLTGSNCSIVLSGILYDQAEEVSAVYRSWFDMQCVDQEDGWVLLAGVKR